MVLLGQSSDSGPFYSTCFRRAFGRFQGFSGSAGYDVPIRNRCVPLSFVAAVGHENWLMEALRFTAQHRICRNGLQVYQESEISAPETDHASVNQNWMSGRSCGQGSWSRANRWLHSRSVLVALERVNGILGLEWGAAAPSMTIDVVDLMCHESSRLTHGRNGSASPVHCFNLAITFGPVLAISTLPVAST